MASTPEGRIESIHEGGATLPNDLDDEVEEDVGALPRMRVEQLRARQQELDDARLQLEQERAELEREIECRGDGGRARAMAHDVNRRIIEDNGAFPHFAQTSQNIAAAVALLRGLLKPETPEDRRVHYKIRTLLDCVVVQQAESSLS